MKENPNYNLGCERPLNYRNYQSLSIGIRECENCENCEYRRRGRDSMLIKYYGLKHIDTLHIGMYDTKFIRIKKLFICRIYGLA